MDPYVDACNRWFSSVYWSTYCECINENGILRPDDCLGYVHHCTCQMGGELGKEVCRNHSKKAPYEISKILNKK